MDKENLEVVLKKFWKDSAVRTVISVDSAPAVGKFLNFLSTVNRLSLKVVLDNGRVTTKSLIVKNAEFNEYAEKWQNDYSVFKIETTMYLTVLKEMEWLMEEFEDNEGLLWCQLIHHIPYTCLVLEDLQASGFVMKLRKEMFDLETIQMATHALGRLHAMSKILQERGVISKEVYKPWFVFNDTGMHNFWFWNMTATVEGIKKYWSPRWSSFVEKFLKLNSKDLHDKIKDIGKLDEGKFNVLIHGDLNKNNIMFKMDWANRPIEIRFLDYQLISYGSPCCDLSYLMYQCMDPQVRRDNYNLILQTYYDSLLRNLDRFKFTGTKPDLQEIKDMMDKYSFASLYMSVVTYPLQISSKEMSDYINFEKVIATEGKEGYNLEYLNNECLEKVIGPDIEKLATFF